MNPMTRSLVASIAAGVCLWPAAGAQASPAIPSDRTASVEQVRSSFSSAGFQVQQAHTWDWASPPVTSIQVRDQSGARVLMVLVYPNPAAAQTARLQAQANEQAQNPGGVANATTPHLVDSYGASVWNGNVALVQTTQSELDRLFQLQNDLNNCVDVDPSLVLAPSPRSGTVDLDFQQALNS